MMTKIRRLLRKLETLRRDEKYFIVKLNRIRHKLVKIRKEIRGLEERIDNTGEEFHG